MRPEDRTTVELLERAAQVIEAFGYEDGPFAMELRSRAARLREALIATEQGTRDFPGSGMVSRFDALRAINAPSTPIAKDQP